MGHLILRRTLVPEIHCSNDLSYTYAYYRTNPREQVVLLRSAGREGNRTHVRPDKHKRAKLTENSAHQGICCISTDTCIVFFYGSTRGHGLLRTLLTLSKTSTILSTLSIQDVIKQARSLVIRHETIHVIAAPFWGRDGFINPDISQNLLAAPFWGRHGFINPDISQAPFWGRHGFINPDISQNLLAAPFWGRHGFINPDISQNLLAAPFWGRHSFINPDMSQAPFWGRHGFINPDISQNLLFV